MLEVTRRLTDLGQILGRAHYHLRDQMMDQANGTLAQLRLLMLGMLALLVLLGLALAWVVYRHLIAPLRLSLVETQTRAERNEKLASLGLLAAGVAHEIRNPLTAIKAALFIQQKKLRPGSPEFEDTDLVSREVSRLERIVSDFLLFARPTEPNLSSVPAEQPLREVQELLSAQLARTRIKLVRESSPPLNVRVDPGQIKQVLINLVQNAADSIQGPGTITLRSRRDHRRLADGETEVAVLEVADTGRGIAPELEKRLFDPFFSTKEGGTGLGLSIAARIVEKHGGTLEYRTKIDHGTTFSIVLPESPA
jgi:signal transduction histidine kinase